MRRPYFLAVYALLLVVLVATSPPRRVGDGGEYLAMALNIAHHGRPSFSTEDIARVETHLRSIGSGFEIVRLTMPDLRARDGRQDLPHFWLYSAAAAPFVVLAGIVGLHANYGFAALNAALLFLAAVVISRRVSLPLATLMLASPIVWWVDKAHSDAATFALLSIGFALIQERPWLAAAAVGAAAAQNPAIALIWPAVVLAGVLVERSRWRDRRLWGGVAAGLALLLLHPLYYEARLGVPTPILGWTERHVPGPWEMSRFLIDPNIGLFFGFPMSLAVVAVAATAIAASAPRRLAGGPVWIAAGCAVVLLASFAQSVNANHGATPGMNRWTLWLVPLAIPLLREFDAIAGSGARAFLASAAALSAAWSLTLFHPRWPENYTRPSRAAEFLWSRYPGLDHPTPEVFGERLTHREPPIFPIATATCSKVLLFEGRWPNRCEPLAQAFSPADVPRMPARCRRNGRVCYANRTRDGYSFVESAVPPGLDFRIGDR